MFLAPALHQPHPFLAFGKWTSGWEVSLPLWVTRGTQGRECTSTFRLDGCEQTAVQSCGESRGCELMVVDSGDRSAPRLFPFLWPPRAAPLPLAKGRSAGNEELGVQSQSGAVCPQGRDSEITALSLSGWFGERGPGLADCGDEKGTGVSASSPPPGGWSKALLLGPSGSCSKSLRWRALLWEV